MLQYKIITADGVLRTVNAFQNTGNPRTRIYVHAHIHAHVHAHIYALTHMSTRVYIHADAHIHTPTHTYIYQLSHSYIIISHTHI